MKLMLKCDWCGAEKDAAQDPTFADLVECPRCGDTPNICLECSDKKDCPKCGYNPNDGVEP